MGYATGGPIDAEAERLARLCAEELARWAPVGCDRLALEPCGGGMLAARGYVRDESGAERCTLWGSAHPTPLSALEGARAHGFAVRVKAPEGELGAVDPGVKAGE